MTHTLANDYDRIVPNRAQGYVYGKDDGALHNKRFYDTSNTFSAGILLSTVRDLLTWSQALRTRRDPQRRLTRTLVDAAAVAGRQRTRDRLSLHAHARLVHRR